MRVLSQHQGLKPLLYVGTHLVLSRAGNLFVSDLALQNPRPLCSLPMTRWSLMAHSALLKRITRMMAGPAILDPASGAMIVWFLGQAWRVDLETGAFTGEDIRPRGKNPLQMVAINQPGFTPGLYFGEYFFNHNKAPAVIWRRGADNTWIVAYTFPAGVINHVHGIFPDPDRGCVYVLTGDYGAAAAIWRTEDDFVTLVPMVSGDQSARACWMTVGSQGMTYATDTHLETNFVYQLNIGAGRPPQQKKLFPIMGSSIYAADLPDPNICFSTSIEPIPPTGFKPYDLLTRKRGAGILSDHACVYHGSTEDGFDIILKARKDWLPPRLFGFGTFHFPAGRPPRAGIAHAYGVALAGAHDTTFVLGR